MMPVVSVCIPTYNGAAYLSQCLDSVIRQTCQSMEILVVDDNSNDDSVAIAERYAREDKRVLIIPNKLHLGLVKNWNRCVELATGEWIKFVFQDDRIEPSCVSRMLNAIRPGVDLVVVRRVLEFEQGTPTSVQELYTNHLAVHNLPRHFADCSYIPAQAFGKLILENPFGNCLGEPTAVMIRRSAFAKYGYFNP